MSQDKLPHMPEKSALMFHHTFHPKPKIGIEDDKILEDT